MTAVALRAEEVNFWPFAVRQVKPDGTTVSGEYLGPLFFQKTRADGAEARGFRPFYLHTQHGEKETTLLFYPLFTWRRDGEGRSFSFSS